MKTIVFAMYLVLLGSASCASAQSGVSSNYEGEHLTHGQVKHLTREAHTPEQYKILAGYYEQRRLSYEKQAEQEKEEWIRRSQYATGVGTKYPRPVDSASYLYEYYEDSAKEMSDLSSKYRQLVELTETKSNPTTKSAH